MLATFIANMNKKVGEFTKITHCEYCGQRAIVELDKEGRECLGMIDSHEGVGSLFVPLRHLPPPL